MLSGLRYFDWNFYHIPFRDNTQMDGQSIEMKNILLANLRLLPPTTTPQPPTLYKIMYFVLRPRIVS